MAVGTPTTNQGNSATPSCAVPAGVASGDIVVMVVELDDPTVALAAKWPAGFTSLLDAQGTADGARYGMAWKRLTGADSGSYTLASLGAPILYVATVVPLTGRHATTAPTLSANSIQNTAVVSPATITANGVTAVAGDDILFVSIPDVKVGFAGTGHASWTAGYTEIVDFEDTTTGFCNVGVAKAESVAAGATGTKTVTFTTSSGLLGWGAWLLAIPAAAGGTTQVSTTRRVNYAVQAQVAATRRVNYGVLANVAATRRVAYSVQAQVAATRRIRYDVLAAVAATRRVGYIVGTTQVAATRRITFSVQAQVAATKRIVYGVLAQVAATRRIGYGVNQAVVATRRVNYSVQANVTSQRRFTYVVGLAPTVSYLRVGAQEGVLVPLLPSVTVYH